jgi:hypothetical protein
MWPFKGKKDFKGADSKETTTGGSTVYCYEKDAFSNPQFGFLEGIQEYVKQREHIFAELFGKSENVFHELNPIVPHIDIYSFKPGYDGRDYWTFVSSGMSDLRMALPKGISSEYFRTELIFYCNEPLDRYAEILRKLAHFPHDNKTWLGPGHTFPNGQPPIPIFEESTVLDSFLFMPTIVSPDNDLAKKLLLGGDPVNFLWLVPLSTAECNLKLKKGVDALYDIFEKVHHPYIFNPNRKSYI